MCICWHQLSQLKVTKLIKAKAVVIQGEIDLYWAQYTIEQEIICKMLINKFFILILLRMENRCKIISIWPTKLYGIFRDLFKTHFGIFCNGSSSNFEFYLLLKRLLKFNNFSWGSFHQWFPNNFDSLIQMNQATMLLNGRFGTKCRFVRNTSLVEGGRFDTQC